MCFLIQPFCWILNCWIKRAQKQWDAIDGKLPSCVCKLIFCCPKALGVVNIDLLAWRAWISGEIEIKGKGMEVGQQQPAQPIRQGAVNPWHFIFHFTICVSVRFAGQSWLGRPDNSLMRGILFLEMQMQGEKRNKVFNLAALFALQARFYPQNLIPSLKNNIQTGSL